MSRFFTWHLIEWNSQGVSFATERCSPLISLRPKKAQSFSNKLPHMRFKTNPQPSHRRKITRLSHRLTIEFPQQSPYFFCTSVNSPIFINNLLVLNRHSSKVFPHLVNETTSSVGNSSVSIVESVAYDPWKLLVAVTLLNKTTGKVAIPVFWRLLEKWETPLALSNGMFSYDRWLISSVGLLLYYLAYPEELRNHIRALGTHNIRSKRLIEMSRVYHYDPPVEYDLRPSRPVVSPMKRPRKGGTRPRRLAEKYPPTAISHLPGAGTYALDSYRIFCLSHQDPLCEEWTTVLPADKELVLFLVCRCSI